jgi:glutamate synthase domain-containing protein 3
MSGGIAYVYDKAGTLSGHFNGDSAEMKPLHEKSIPELRTMLERHGSYTGSATAKSILENWEAELKHFVRVMPRDYARVMKQQEQTQAEVTHAS